MRKMMRKTIKIKLEGVIVVLADGHYSQLIRPVHFYVLWKFGNSNANSSGIINKTRSNDR